MSKLNAREIYQKNHPDTYKDLFSAFKDQEQENNKKQFSKKNQEWATLGSYKEHFEKEKELQARLVEKYGGRKLDQTENIGADVRQEQKRPAPTGGLQDVGLSQSMFVSGSGPQQPQRGNTKLIEMPTWTETTSTMCHSMEITQVGALTKEILWISFRDSTVDYKANRHGHRNSK